MMKENDENDQLILFKTAELAKEKGFNWETQAVFTDFNKVPYSNPQEETPYNWNSRAGYSAPTQSLLQKWLRVIHKIQRMEYDCEKKSVDFMNKHNLPFDMDRIIQRNNAYIYFYSIAEKLGGWYYTSPSMVKEIVDVMPKVFLPKVEDYRNVDKPVLFILYKRYCMRKNQETEVIE